MEIGANTCIDRGALDATIIEDNVIIDNLCQIAIMFILALVQRLRVALLWRVA